MLLEWQPVIFYREYGNGLCFRIFFLICRRPAVCCKNSIQLKSPCFGICFLDCRRPVSMLPYWGWKRLVVIMLLESKLRTAIPSSSIDQTAIIAWLEHPESERPIQYTAIITQAKKRQTSSCLSLYQNERRIAAFSTTICWRWWKNIKFQLDQTYDPIYQER